MNPMKSKASSFNPYMNIYCSVDIDFSEIVKSEAFRKYEENVYLLGTIFNTAEDREEKGASDIEIESDDEEVNDIFNEKENNDEEDMNQDEKIQHLIREYNRKYKNTEDNDLKRLITQLNSAYKDYKNEESFLDANQKAFKDKVKKYEDMMNKLKNAKNIENEEYFKNIMNNAENLGVISETFKQVEKYNKGNITKINKDIPFGENCNLLINPL